MTQERETLREGKLLYQRLRSQLRRDIVAGVYPVHSRIPSEMELCRRYQVSRVTVRKALGALVNDGLLERYQGKGTFVSVPRLSKSLRDVNSFSSACRAMGCEPQTRLIAAHLIPGDELLCAALSCPPEENLVEMIRLRLADDKPVMLEINHFPAAYAWLVQERLDGSLYDLLKTRGWSPVRPPMKSACAMPTSGTRSGWTWKRAAPCCTSMRSSTTRMDSPCIPPASISGAIGSPSAFERPRIFPIWNRK